MEVYTCVVDFRLVKIRAKNVDNATKTEECAWVAIPPHLKMTSHNGFWPELGKVDLCWLRDAIKASKNVESVFIFLTFLKNQNDIFNLKNHFCRNNSGNST